MTHAEGSWISLAITATTVMLGISMVLSFIRLVRGPSLPDRVVALDLFATIVVGIIAVDTITTERPETLRSATVLALVAFLGTVAFARYVEKRGAP